MICKSPFGFIALTAAMCLTIAGGSTNAVLHLIAIARQGRLDIVLLTQLANQRSKPSCIASHDVGACGDPAWRGL